MNIEAEAQRITLFIREMLDKSDTEGIVVGLSGGIDSAL
ncbi:MAG: NAD+ synthase, partial [Candidatus Helarchaeota archaeon]